MTINKVSFTKNVTEFASGTSQAFGGGVDPNSIMMAYFLLNLQADHGITGDLAEIGVKQGRYLVLMASGLQPGERLYGVDPYFDLPEIRNHPAKYVAELVGDIDLQMIFADSLTLDAASLTRSGSPGIRLFHIDGNHEEPYVLNDLRLADQCLRDGGIIILDDYFHFTGIGVGTAVFEHLIIDNTTDLVPVFAVGAKFYLCHKTHVATYQSLFMKTFDKPRSAIMQTTWMKHPIISASLIGRIPDALNSVQASKQ